MCVCARVSALSLRSKAYFLDFGCKSVSIAPLSTEHIARVREQMNVKTGLSLNLVVVAF